uniref:Uncharacterized protein n=1 Tax=Oryza sativa subsp. japonica TaxID=39947 RepID=Q8H5D6_ORYSJ|nr:hypothetical protein [Oryza sativa Japonica Group]
MALRHLPGKLRLTAAAAWFLVALDFSPAPPRVWFLLLDLSALVRGAAGSMTMGNRGFFTVEGSR